MGLHLGLGLHLGGSASAPDPYGPELVIDPSFDADASWIKQGTWTVSGGAAHSAGTNAEAVYQNRTQTQGVQYRVEFTVANYVTGTVTAGPYNSSGGTGRIANGTFVEIQTAGAGSAFLMVTGSAGFVGDVTYFSVKQVL